MDELTTKEYDEIHAMRRIKFVAHDQEDWRAAVSAAAIMSSLSGQSVDPVDVLKVIRPNLDDAKSVSPDQAARMGKHGNDR